MSIAKTKNYHVVTFGCQMNKSDSERIASVFEQYDCLPVDRPELADYIVLNTCSIKQAAEDKAYGKVANFEKLKVTKPDLKVVVTGCMAQRPDAIKRKSGIDLAINIKDIGSLPEKLGLTKVDQQVAKDYFSIAPKFGNKFQAYIPISTGCNNFCTFCVVPFTRGREYSRPMDEVLKECRLAIANGAKEIMLLGQNVNSYEYGFEKLLKELNTLPGDFWVRFVSSNPQDMSLELIETVAKGEKLCKWIHFAVQSGNDRILKRMNRRHTISDYLKLYEFMKAQMPEAGISTDIIVGFPSETEGEFNDTASLFEKVKYDMAYISMYSARTNTPAWRMKDDVSKEEKKRRNEVLDELLGKTAKENGQKLIGSTRRVLIDRISRRGMPCGKESGYRTVNITNSTDEALVGRFVDVKITQAFEFGLEGELV